MPCSTITPQPTPSDFYSVGDLVRLTGETRAVVGYWLERLRLEPSRRVGNVRLFDAGALQHLQSALNRRPNRYF